MVGVIANGASIFISIGYHGRHDCGADLPITSYVCVYTRV